MAEQGTEISVESKRRTAREPYSGLNVLRTEAKDDLAAALAQIRQYIEPKDFIEEMYVRDQAHYDWQLMRARRIETAILNNALERALKQILHQILHPPIDHSKYGLLDGEQLQSDLQQRELQSQTSAYAWLFNAEAKGRVSDLLRDAGIDESAIEAQAFCLVADDLEKARRMVRSAEDGRDKALRSIAKHRKNFAKRLRGASDRVLVADQVPSVAPEVN
jgi:hypothetical protein